MAEVHGTCDPAVRGRARRARGQPRPGHGRRRVGRRRARRRAGRRHLGRPRRRGEDEAVGARHDHQRLVDDQDDDGPVRADAGRPRRARPRRAGRPLLARVQGRRQGERRGPPPPGAHRRPVRVGRSRCSPRTCTTGRRRTSLLAAQEPWWEPGTASGYHAITQGYLVGEVVRRITGADDRHVLREGGRRAARRRLPHRHAGPSTTTASRRVIPPPPLAIGHDRPDEHRRPHARQPAARRPSSRGTIAWRRAEIPAAGGHGNARSVAAVQSVAGHGGEINGDAVPVRPRPAASACFEEQSHGPTSCSACPLRFGMGYGLNVRRDAARPQPAHVLLGRLGRFARLIDLDARMSIAYVMNKMGEGTARRLPRRFGRSCRLRRAAR